MDEAVEVDQVGRLECDSVRFSGSDSCNGVEAGDHWRRVCEVARSVVDVPLVRDERCAHDSENCRAWSWLGIGRPSTSSG